MSAVTWLRLRAELHSGIRFVVFAVVLLGLGGGASLTAAAAARRTDSAFERLETATHASDVLANPEDLAASGLSAAAIAALPGVEQVGAAYGIPALRGECTDTGVAVLAVESAVVMYEIDRPVVRSGRLPDPSRADEAFANEAAAEALGLEVGDSFEFVVLPLTMLENLDEATCAAVAAGTTGTRQRLTLVGIGVTVADVAPHSVLPSLVLTPAWWQASPREAHFAGFAARLRDGAAGLPQFTRAVQALAGDVAVDFQTTAADRHTVERALRPQVVALWVFAVILGAGTALALGQAMLRRARVDERDAPALTALGMRRRDRSSLGVGRAVAVAVLGAGLAVAVAVACSGFFPRGLGRTVEPHRGVRLEATTLADGALLFGVAAAVGVAAASLAARQRSHAPPGPRFVPILGQPGNPSLATGLGMMTGTRHEEGAWMSVAALAVGTAAVVASLTFASSLRRLVTTPQAYGWNFDALVETGDTIEAENQSIAAAMPTVLNRLPGVTGWSTVAAAQVRLGDRVEPILAVGAHGDKPAYPTILAGRVPDEPTDVAAGLRTLEHNGWAIGDEVRVGGGTFTVVGKVVLPGISSYPASDQAALGTGLLLTEQGLTRAVAQGSPASAFWATTLAPGVGPQDLAASLDAKFGPRFTDVVGPQRPSDIQALAGARATPLVLAAVLALLAVSVLVQALLASVRRHRRDLAILRTLGFTRRQVVASVTWHSSLVAASGLALGVPLGLVVGRILWSRVADELGVSDEWVLPGVAVLAMIVVILVVGNITAAWPAAQAARARPANILRAE